MTRIKTHIRRGDVVRAIAGDDAASGKSGKVVRVMAKQGRAVVEGLNLVKKAMRKSQDNPHGGILEKEAPMAISNLKLQQSAEGKKESAGN